jgi:hypothetical protein
VPPSFDRALPRELLRDVNDRVATIGSRDDEILSFLCECADEFCVDQVAIQRKPLRGDQGERRERPRVRPQRGSRLTERGISRPNAGAPPKRAAEMPNRRSTRSPTAR